MIEYIYIVKCPDREDEMFNFFTDARMQCDLLMSKKPYITQVEVERNDFGECTDSHDLGTVWSWEEAMKDTEGGYTEAEPAKTLFTKDDLKLMADGQDPEFDNLDNSVDCEVEEPETSEVSPIERKPIPEGMTIEQLVEEMEENEDTVECTQCNELFDKSTCRKELNLGWCCSRCADDLIARGEDPVFKSDNYWDFLDEDFEELSFSEMVADSVNHLINDLGKDSSAEDFADDVIADIENNYDTEVPEDPEKYRDWASAVACEVSRQLNNQPQLDEELEAKTWICEFDGKEIGTVEAVTEEEAYEAMEHKYYDYNYGLYDGVAMVYPADEDLTEASLSDIAAAANSEFGSSWDDDYLLNIAGVDDDFRNTSHSINNKTKEKSIEQPKENCVSDFEKKKADYEARAKRYIEAGKAAEYNDRYDREIVLRDWCPAIDIETNELIYDKAIKQAIAQKAFEGRRARYAAQRKAYASRPKWLCAYTVNGKTYETTTAMGDDAEAARQTVVNKVKKAELEAQKFGEPFDWDGTVKIIKCTKPDGTEEVFEGFDPEIIHDLGNEYDGGYPAETPEVSDSHLRLCPECGKETFDIETGICVGCGFN